MSSFEFYSNLERKFIYFDGVSHHIKKDPVKTGIGLRYPSLSEYSAKRLFPAAKVIAEYCYGILDLKIVEILRKRDGWEFKKAPKINVVIDDDDDYDWYPWP